MAEGTVFSDNIIRLCPLRPGPRERRICDEDDCAWWDDYRKRCKVMSCMEAFTYAVNKQFPNPRNWKKNEERG